MGSSAGSRMPCAQSAAQARRCCCPPDTEVGYLPRISPISNIAAISLTVDRILSRQSLGLQGEGDVFTDGQWGIERISLKGHGDATSCGGNACMACLQEKSIRL